MVEKQLEKSKGESILPGGITAADLHFLPWIKQHEYAGLKLDDYPNLAKWLKTLMERKEVSEGYRKIFSAPKAGE